MKPGKTGILIAILTAICLFSLRPVQAEYSQGSAVGETWQPLTPFTQDEKTSDSDLNDSRSGFGLNKLSAKNEVKAVALPEPKAEDPVKNDGKAAKPATDLVKDIKETQKAAKEEPIKLAEDLSKEEKDFYTEQARLEQGDKSEVTDEEFTAENPPNTGPVWQDSPGNSLVPPAQTYADPKGRLGGDGKIKLYHSWTKETLELQYKTDSGEYAPGAAEKLKRFFRCRLTGEEMPIPIKLVEVLDILQDRMGGKTITLLSGYRSARLNGSLKGAARNSLHMRGWAADISIPGVSPSEVRSKAWAMQAGGVGSYPTFTHVDVGRVRSW